MNYDWYAGGLNGYSYHYPINIDANVFIQNWVTCPSGSKILSTWVIEIEHEYIATEIETLDDAKALVAMYLAGKEVT